MKIRRGCIDDLKNALPKVLYEQEELRKCVLDAANTVWDELVFSRWNSQENVLHGKADFNNIIIIIITVNKFVCIYYLFLKP